MTIESLKEKARRYEQDEEWIKALDLYLQAIERYSDEDEPDIALYNRVGDIQVRLGDVEGAVENYEAAIQLYRDADLPNNAIAVCRKIIRHAPRRPSPFLRMGQIRASQGFIVDARQNFLTYAEMKQAVGETDEAFRALEEFVGLAPDDTATRIFLAEQLVARERPDDALVLLADAYRVLAREDELDAAAGVLDRIRAIDPDHPEPEPHGPASEPAQSLERAMKDERPDGLAGFESTSLGEGLAPVESEEGAGPVAEVEEPAGLETTEEAVTPSDDASDSAEIQGIAGLEHHSASEFTELTGAGADESDLESEASGSLGSGVEGGKDEEREEFDEEHEEFDEEHQEFDEEREKFGAEFEEFGGELGEESEAFGEKGEELGEEGQDVEAFEFSLDMEGYEEEDDAIDGEEADFDDDFEPLPLLDEESAAPAEAAEEDLVEAHGDGLAGEDLDAPDEDDEISEMERATEEAFEEVSSERTGPVAEEEGDLEVEDWELSASELIDEEEAPEELDPVDDLRDRIERDPSDAQAWRHLGEALYERGDQQEGRAALERAHEAYADDDDPEKAMRVVRELLIREPDRLDLRQRVVEYAHRTNERTLLVQAFLELADGLRAAGESQKAEAVYMQVLSLDPNNLRAREAMGRPVSGVMGPDAPASGEPPGGRRAGGDYVDLGSMVLDADGERTTRWVVPAEAPSGDEEADFSKMLSQFKEKVAENIASDDVKSHYDLGTAFKEMGLLDEAIGEFQQALRAQPRSLATLEMLGQCFLDKGEPDVAIRTMERGTRLETPVEDDLLGIYYFLAQAYEQVGNTDAAREFYEKVFSLDINFRDVTERLRTLR